MKGPRMEMLHFVVPPLEVPDRRYDEAIAALKGLFPDRPLAWVMVQDLGDTSTSRHSVRIPPIVPATSARDQIVEAVAAGLRVTLLDDRKSPILTLTFDGEEPGKALNGERMATVEISVPPESLRGERGMEVVAACGDALAAHHMAHMANHVVFEVQFVDELEVMPGSRRRSPETEEALKAMKANRRLPPEVEAALKANPCLRSLPRLRRGAGLPSPRIPRRLGEWNYWSAATSKLLGDLEPGRDDEWLACSRKTPAGGTVLRLADGAFDPMRSDHCAQLLRAYERFSGVGARLT